MTVGLTLCSGIGAPEVAATWVRWSLAAEIEPFPRAILQARHGYRLPADHNQGDPLLWSDMTEVTPDLLRARGLALPDLVVAGTPCQAFSVAGLRKGTEDPRGNLTLAFVELLHGLVAARPDGRLAALWENVPGVLSDKGNAFGAFLGGIVGADDALSPLGGGSWPDAGMVAGPRARVAWRVLDAQYFGVAQRRRRVFAVLDFGGACDPAAVLFEPQGLRGDTPPRRGEGEVAPTVPARSLGGGGLGTDFDCDGGLIRIAFGGNNQRGPIDIATAVNAHGGPHGRLDFESETFVAHGPGCYGLSTQQEPKWADDLSPTLAMPSKSGGGQVTAVAFIVTPIDMRQASRGAKMTNNRAEGSTGGAPGTGIGEPGDPAPSLANSHTPAVAHGWAVRRLTPTECERLQGFPDGFTDIAWRGKPAAPDGPRYKALGNSMAVPCIRWILDRLRLSMADHGHGDARAPLWQEAAE